MNTEVNRCKKCKYLHYLDPSNTTPCFGCMWRKMQESMPDYEWRKKLAKRPKSPAPKKDIMSYEEFKDLMAKEAHPS